MRAMRKLAAALLAVSICLCVLRPLPARAEGVCFTAINDSVMHLSAEGMPIWSGDVIYAPYTTFDGNVNGVLRSIECTYDKNNGMVTVYDINQRLFLEFDLREGTCVDAMTGYTYKLGAILRGGMPYLPVKVICTHFDLRYSYRELDVGSMLRIKNNDVVLSDAKFVDAASNVLELRLKEYNQSQGGGESTPAAPDIPQTPTQPEEPDTPDVDTYLAFRCDDDEYLHAILLTLGTGGTRCVFYLTPELIRTRCDLVIWMLGEGHTVGILAQGEDEEQTRQILDEGSRAMADLVFARARTAMVPAGQRESMEQEGWICWDATLDLTPEETTGPNYFANRTIRQLGSRTADTYLSLDDGPHSLRVLPTLLDRLDEEGFELTLPLDTRL